MLALVNLSVNRFLLSALSASLPRTVDGPLLLTANSLTPTLGAAAAGRRRRDRLRARASCCRPGAGKDAAALVLAACVMAAARRAGHPAGQGPPGSRRARGRRRSCAPQLGAARPRPGRRRALPRRPTDPGPRARRSWPRTGSSTASCSSRASSSPATCCRDPADTDAGLRRSARARARRPSASRSPSSLTPVLIAATGPHAWIVALPGRSPRSSQLLLVASSVAHRRSSSPPARSAWPRRARRSRSTRSSSATPTTPTAGRAFALYDVLYNAAFVGAAALGAVTLPDTGYSRGLFLVLALGVRRPVAARLRLRLPTGAAVQPAEAVAA